MKERKIRGGRQCEWPCKDGISLEINLRIISIIRRSLTRFGLDFKKIGKTLHMREDRVHKIIVEIEKFNYTIIEKALRVFMTRQRAKGKGLKKREHGLLPLEYYLTALS